MTAARLSQPLASTIMNLHSRGHPFSSVVVPTATPRHSDSEHCQREWHTAQAWSVSKPLRHSAVGIYRAGAQTVCTQQQDTQWLAR